MANKLIFLVKNELNINCWKRKEEELAKNENNENIIDKNEIIKRTLLGKKIK